MLGFRTREEMEDVFSRPIAQAATNRLQDALNSVREKGQADEYALALAVETEILERMNESGEDLQNLFNDPKHHNLPADDLAQKIVALWDDQAS